MREGQEEGERVRVWATSLQVQKDRGSSDSGARTVSQAGSLPTEAAVLGSRTWEVDVGVSRDPKVEMGQLPKKPAQSLAAWQSIKRKRPVLENREGP